MNNVKSANNKVFGRIAVIDQSTYEKIHLESKTTCDTYNIRYKKSRQMYNLGQFMKSKCVFQQPIKPSTYAIYKRKTDNLKKSKRRQSKLKKCILNYRLQKRNGDHKKSSPTRSETEDMTQCFEKLAIGDANLPEVHSGRFREYCDNTTSQELCNLVDSLLRELYRFQKRAFQCNKYKARSRRRIAIGFREVLSQLEINKIKFVVIATDCEKCDLEGGLDNIITRIKNNCSDRTIPYGFVFQRRQLSYILFKKSPISCVGILDFDGVQDIFFKMLNVLELEKTNYKLCQKNLVSK